MIPQEKGQIIDFEHKVTKDFDINQRTDKTALIDIKIHAWSDSMYYTDEKHRKMVNEIEKVIRKFI